MSLVVSDSGPIHYLVLCEAIRLIPELYGELVIPGAVAQELAHPQTPEVVRAWLQALPNWARIRNPRQIEPVMQLGLGEREAISLAHELKASQLLIDDRLARRVAVERGLLITGTVGILELAAERGLLNLPDTLQKLLQTNFRIDAEVIRLALERDAVRSRRGPQRPGP